MGDEMAWFRNRCFCVLVLCLILTQLGQTDAVCTYAEVSAALNTCTSVASGTANTKWMLPYGTTAQQATFCQTDKQTALDTCIQGVIWPCISYAKVIKTFGTNGTNLINAYTTMCANNLVIDAQGCMSTITPISTFTTAEASYTTSVDALPTAASYTEMCGLILTLHYTAYTTLLTPSCTTDTHLAVWTTFYSHVLNTYVCTPCTGSVVMTTVWFPVVMTFIARVFQM